MYALVSYIPGPLGEFLNNLRADLVPHCRLLSHLTLLPPRVLSAPRSALESALATRLPEVRPFEVRLGEIQTFEETKVVFVELESGQDTARGIHSRLAQDVLAYEERFDYHPHVTLAQEFPADQFESLLAEARSRWNRWTGPRSFQVEELVFVQNRDVNTWDALAAFRLSPNGHP